MVEIKSREELEAWLKEQGRADFAQVIAARAALRVLPYACAKGVSEFWISHSSLKLFRAYMISWASQNFSAYDMVDAANAAAESAVDILDAYGIESVDEHSYDARAADDAADAADHAAIAAGAAIEASASRTYALVRAADAAVSAFSANVMTDQAFGRTDATSGGEMWANVSNDCSWLESVGSPVSASLRLTHESLWPAGEPDDWHYAWTHATGLLAALDQGYSVWIDWYNRRIKGHESAFDIPGDHDRTEDKKILARLADATDEEFWDKGATYVNTTLQRWIDEARERVKPPKLSKAELEAAIIKYASPDARIVDDKLDAGPNAVFDKPRYDGDLATLPSQMRAFIGVLAKGLGNAPDIVRNCIAAYDDELLVRGTQPIVGTLKGLASAIAAQVWVTPDEAIRDNPDAWVLKFEREWDPGTADLLRSFFKTHIDLITHFPLDAEREAMFAATPIDEVAASDKALTDPVDKVAELIVTLAQQGLATENIVRIVEAHALYTRDISGMPRPDEAQLPSTTITPKRRHILQTAGFYLHAYSILGTTAQLATLPQVQPLMTALADAAAQLLSFIL